MPLSNRHDRSGSYLRSDMVEAISHAPELAPLASRNGYNDFSSAFVDSVVRMILGRPGSTPQRAVENLK